MNYKKITSDDVKAYLDKQPWETYGDGYDGGICLVYRDDLGREYKRYFKQPDRLTQGTADFSEAVMECYGYSQDEWNALDDDEHDELEESYLEDYYVDELFGWANGELLDSDDYEEACEELADEANAWYAENEITDD